MRLPVFTCILVLTAATAMLRPAAGEQLPAGPLTVEDAIRIALENHGSVSAAAEGVLASRQRVIQARTGTLPRVTGEVSYTVSGQEHRTSGSQNWESFTRSSDGAQPRVAVSYNIYDGGLTRASARQASAEERSSRAVLATVRNSLSLQVAQAFFNQLRALRTLEIRRQLEGLAEEQLRAVEARIEAGAAAPADRALPLSELRNRQVDVVQAENDLAVSAVTLRQLMGLPPGPALELQEVSGQPDAGNLDQWLEAARKNRPELVEAQARVESAAASLEAARVRRSPRVDLAAAYDLTPASDSRRQDWTVGAAISMPLWDGQLTAAQVAEAEARLRAARATLEQQEKDVASEVTRAYRNLVSALERVEATKAALEAARVNLESETERYMLQAAGSSVLALQTAQVQYATASTNDIQARYDVQAAWSQLQQAIGGLQ